MDGYHNYDNISQVGSSNNIYQVDGYLNYDVTSYDNICQMDGYVKSQMHNVETSYDNIYQGDGCLEIQVTNYNNTCQVDGVSNEALCQLDGNATINCSSRNSSVSVVTSLDDYDSEEEAENEPIRAVLVPCNQMDGDPFSLTVDQSDQVATPASLPLTMVANFRSCYNKVKNVRQSLYTLGLDFLVGTETWERPQQDLETLLGSPNYRVISYCRGREVPAVRMEGRLAGKEYPGKIGGGAAIFYNSNTFEAVDTQIGVPAGIEAVWSVFAPQRLDSQFQKVRRICVAAIYIAPRSPFKGETITHIIETIHMIRARFNNEVHFLVGGDFNRVEITDILLSYGALQQVCEVATRQGAALQLVMTDLHTFLHPPTAQPPIQVDEGSKGKNGDHQALILAPKANKDFVVKRERREIITRPMPETQIQAFCAELTKHKWRMISWRVLGFSQKEEVKFRINDIIENGEMF